LHESKADPGLPGGGFRAELRTVSMFPCEVSVQHDGIPPDDVRRIQYNYFPMKEKMESRLSLLSDLRVLELGHFVAAPFCTRLLADLGADVIKVEPHSGDPVRQWGETLDGRSLWWSVHGRNKRCITFDLKSERAREIVLQLVAHCDVVVENFRPGQLEKLGLGPDVLRTVKPDLVISRISGYGQSGPYRDRAAFGVIGEAIGGLRYLTNHKPGTTDLPPVRVGVSIGDSLAGLYAAFGIMAAVWRRDRHGGDGVGRTIDVALTESVLSLMEGMLPEFGALGKVKQPTGGGIATAAPSNAYATKDGSWVLIAANSEPLFAKLAHLMGRPELIGAAQYNGNRARVQNALTLDALIGEWTRHYEIGELIDMLNAADIPNSKAYTAADCAVDSQYLERGMVHAVEDPQFGKKILHPGIVPHVPEMPGMVRWPGPDIGEHTEAILTELLAMTSEQIVDLRQQGVI
jgi:crotonobetainyl-CoA:carnitine CoA-transferase CaiB-like acyl-CoA transferase